MSTIKVDTVRPVTADASLTLQGDSSGSGVTGITIDSSGVVNTTTAKVTNLQATSGQSLTIKDEDGNAAITIGTDNTAASYLSLNFGSYHGDSGGAGSGTLSANTLDDYEIGTWTCSVVGQTATATGRYVKIGDMVHVEVYFVCDTNVSTTTTSSVITGLPFSASLTTRCLMNFFAYNLSAVSGAGSAPTISTSIGPAFVLVAATVGAIRPVASTSSNPYYYENIFQSTSSFYMNGTYRIS